MSKGRRLKRTIRSLILIISKNKTCPPICYYQEHEIVYILELDFHRPFVLHEQDSLETLRSLSKIFFIENREMPILYKPLAFGDKSLQRSWKVFVCRYLPTNKIALLCVLCDSALNANNFMLFLLSLVGLGMADNSCNRCPSLFFRSVVLSPQK